MTLFQIILLLFLLVCAVSVSFSKNLLNSVLIYMSFSLIMSIVWVMLESPDLAITEAAVGAGITSLLFFATLKKIHAINTLHGQKGEPEPFGEQKVAQQQSSEAQAGAQLQSPGGADEEDSHE